MLLNIVQDSYVSFVEWSQFTTEMTAVGQGISGTIPVWLVLLYYYRILICARSMEIGWSSITRDL